MTGHLPRYHLTWPTKLCTRQVRHHHSS